MTGVYSALWSPAMRVCLVLCVTAWLSSSCSTTIQSNPPSDIAHPPTYPGAFQVQITKTSSRVAGWDRTTYRVQASTSDIISFYSNTLRAENWRVVGAEKNQLALFWVYPSSGLGWLLSIDIHDESTTEKSVELTLLEDLVAR